MPNDLIYFFYAKMSVLIYYCSAIPNTRYFLSSHDFPNF